MVYPETAELYVGGAPNTGPRFRCFMVPVSPDNVVRQAGELTGIKTKVTYRMFHGDLPSPHEIRSADSVFWRRQKLSVIGIPMCVTANGRIHHYETYLGVEVPG